MSQSIGVHITYDLPYAAEHVVTAMKAINKAVCENWARYRDEWSEPEPLLLPVQAWAEEALPERLQELEYMGLRTTIALATRVDRPIHCHPERSEPQRAQSKDLPRRWSLHATGYRYRLDFYEGRFCSYSPLSWYHLSVRVGEDLRADRLDLLTVSLFVSDNSRGEHEAVLEAHRLRTALEADPTLDEDDAWFDRFHELRNRERSVWPENRACLLHIVEELKRALPVRDVKMDEVLLEP